MVRTSKGGAATPIGVLLSSGSMKACSRRPRATLRATETSSKTVVPHATSDRTHDDLSTLGQCAGDMEWPPIRRDLTTKEPQQGPCPAKTPNGLPAAVGIRGTHTPGGVCGPHAGLRLRPGPRR